MRIQWGTLRTRYFAYFSFYSARHTLKTRANVSLYSSNCSAAVPGAGIRASPDLICATFPMTTLFGNTVLAFFWKINGCSPLCRKSCPRRTISLSSGCVPFSGCTSVGLPVTVWQLEVALSAYVSVLPCGRSAFGLEFRCYAVPFFLQWRDSVRLFYLLVVEKGVRSLKLCLQCAPHDGSLCCQAALPPWLCL